MILSVFSTFLSDSPKEASLYIQLELFDYFDVAVIILLCKVKQ